MCVCLCTLDVFQNVIQQMLAVQPELLTDHTVPPASQFTIDNLSTVSLTMDHIGRFIILRELLTDHTVPPSSQFTIDNLSTVSLTMDHIGRFIIL